MKRGMQHNLAVFYKFHSFLAGNLVFILTNCDKTDCLLVLFNILK